MENNLYVWVLIGATFVSVALIVAGVGFALDRRRQIVTRLRDDATPSSKSLDQALSSIATSVSDRLDTTFSGWGDTNSKSNLRLQLVQAGFFSPRAPLAYTVAQFILPVVLVIAGYFALTAFNPKVTTGMLAVALSALAYAGYKGPEAAVSRLKENLGATYRAAFPDFLDLLIVCTDAGLSMNAALDRVAREFEFGCKPLAINLSLMLSEIRSGRAFPEALENLSVRLGIAEAKSFSTLIKQSIELGSDVGSALRVYADEMRAKRLLRAETIANALPVKMLLPLGLFIFPTLFIIVLTPAMISVTNIFSNLGRR